MNTLIGPVPPTWCEIALRDAFKVQAGPSGATFSPADKAPDGVPDGVPMVTPKSIQNGRIVADGCVTVSREAADRMDRFALRADDIVCTRIGDGRRHALASPEHTGWLLGGACVFLRASAEVLPRYLNHYLRQPLVQRWLAQQVSGAVVPTVSAGTLEELPLVVPPRETQMKIVDLLDALDEKIAAHQEIVQTAE
ncbi:restriction endonuclease, partial [Parafrankia soli]